MTAGFEENMIINLFEIPEEGKTFKYNNETAEVNQSLEDLIGHNKYETEFVITPLNSKDFELRGWINTRTKEICSHCGLNIQFPVKAKFHEILIPPQEIPHNGKYSKPNHFSKTETSRPDCTEYLKDLKFDIGEFLHESIALSVPYNPAPEVNPKGECSDCGQNVKDLLKVINTQNLENQKQTSPFAALKGLKIQN
jgi:uncharacterized protein